MPLPSRPLLVAAVAGAAVLVALAAWWLTRDTTRRVYLMPHGGSGYASLSEAVADAQPDRIIYLQPGVHPGPISLDGDERLVGLGTSVEVVIECDTTDTVTVTGGSPRLENLTLRCLASPEGNEIFTGLCVTGGTPLVERCRLVSERGPGGFVSGAETGPTLRGCEIKSAAMDGLMVRLGAKGLFEDCVFNAAEGANVWLMEESDPTFFLLQRLASSDALSQCSPTASTNASRGTSRRGMSRPSNVIALMPRS